MAPRVIVKSAAGVSRLLLYVALSSIASTAAAQQPTPGGRGGLSASAVAQIRSLEAEKRGRTPVQRKIDPNLIYGLRIASGRATALGLPASLRVSLPMTADGRVILDVRADVSPALLAELRRAGAEIVDANPRYRHVGVRAALADVETIAAAPGVRFVSPEYGATTSSGRVSWPLTRIHGSLAGSTPGAGTALRRARAIDRLRDALRRLHAFQAGPVVNSGAVTSEGDTTHRAAEARAAFGVDGRGVKIGVLSDGVCSLASSQASGELGPVTVLPGQTGFCPGSDEGTAMLEIVHDIAPGAQLYFATAFRSITSFADNIRALRAAGCDIIVDDVSYFAESPFQDGQLVDSVTNGGVVTQAVKDVAGAGAMYFSAAGNSGHVDGGASGTWEGDFVAAVGTGPIDGLIVNDFGGGQLYDTVTSGTLAPTTLYWADPLGAPTADYDLYVLDSTGANVVAVSNRQQFGADSDPFEIVAAPAVNERLVIRQFALAAGAPASVFVHLATNRGQLAIATGGETHAHAATSAANSFGVAATPVCAPYGQTPPGPCTSSFGSGSRVESFSSDGLRRIFFTSSGAAITPGNVSSSGGLVLDKPDLTAADGVRTGVNGFTVFYGTSAAAPHAAAIAALVKSVNLALAPSQVTSALTGTAIDIEQPGFDRDSGRGIVMAYQSVLAASLMTTTPPTITANPPSSTTVLTGQMVVLTTAATGTPAPSAQWQASVDGGATWTNISGATAPSLSFDAKRADNGKRYRCLYANGAGAAATTAAAVFVRLRVRADVDGDRKTDLTLWRPATGTWFWLTSSSGYAPGGAASRQWGNSSLGDVPLSGDMDGDGRADLVVWRGSTGDWFWLTAASGYDYAQAVQVHWGDASRGDVPLLGDIDGDGKSDLLVWRAVDGTWNWLLSSAGYSPASAGSRQWGNAALGDEPLIGDVDGDGLADLTVWRASEGAWYWLTSSSSYSYAASGRKQWGNDALGDVPLMADMDGDGASDLAVWRASTGTFYWITAFSGFSYASAASRQWGNAALGDVPMLGDVDGDGAADLVVWRNSDGTWYWLASGANYSLAGQGQQRWGTSGDIPMIR